MERWTTFEDLFQTLRANTTSRRHASHNQEPVFIVLYSVKPHGDEYASTAPNATDHTGPFVMLSRIRSLLRRQSPESLTQTEDKEEVYEPHPEDYPAFPPASPSCLIQDPDQHWTKITQRKFATPQGIFEDSSLYGLYRLYEAIVLDKVFAYRNGLELFWRQKTWAIKDIADPKDDNSERYAFLAGCTYLLARSFNQRIKLGLSRKMPAIMLHEQIEDLRNEPDHLREYEQVPEWAQAVKPLEETLSIPTHDGELLKGRDDERADPDFLEKNILLWTPHIFFT